ICQSAQKGILVLEVPVGGGLGDACPLGKGAQAEQLGAFGLQRLKTKPQEFLTQVAVVVGVGRFQRRPPVFDCGALISISIL
ncbi:MAG: hypothetical protein RBT68_15345, partial [Spirochaetia bacterium]|nr:hypothetical protein [Spirochaetia bacterium]